MSRQQQYHVESALRIRKTTNNSESELEKGIFKRDLQKYTGEISQNKIFLKCLERIPELSYLSRGVIYEN